MALSGLGRKWCAPPPPTLLGKCDGFDQVIRLEAPVIAYIWRHRQLAPWASEAGGQLFGTICPAEVRVMAASGPYRGDERSRYGYRSNPVAAQRQVDSRARAGQRYLGEWHTHAEDVPCASGMDNDAMRRLLRHSVLSSNGLLLLIVGRAAGPEALALGSVSAGGGVSWRLAVAGSCE